MHSLVVALTSGRPTEQAETAMTDAEIGTITAQQRKQVLLEVLEMRGIDREEDACTNCGGLGVTTYGSTTTWRGGVGGQALTSGVCDSCWGSGNRHKPWPSHRLLRAALARLEAE